MKTYTLGEIVRLGLMKNHKGQPYKDKAAILRVIHKAMVSSDIADDVKRISTPWGEGYAVPQKTIDKLNKRWMTP